MMTIWGLLGSKHDNAVIWTVWHCLGTDEATAEINIREFNSGVGTTDLPLEGRKLNPYLGPYIQFAGTLGVDKLFLQRSE